MAFATIQPPAHYNNQGGARHRGQGSWKAGLLDQSTRLFCFPLLCTVFYAKFFSSPNIFFVLGYGEESEKNKNKSSWPNRACIFCTQKENLKPPAEPSCSFKLFCTLVASSRIRLSVKYTIKYITIKNTSTITQ